MASTSVFTDTYLKAGTSTSFGKKKITKQNKTKKCKQTNNLLPPPKKERKKYKEQDRQLEREMKEDEWKSKCKKRKTNTNLLIHRPGECIKKETNLQKI